MSMQAALEYANRMRQQQAAAEQARAARQEAVQAERRAKEQMLAQQMAEAAAQAPVPAPEPAAVEPIEKAPTPMPPQPDGPIIDAGLRIEIPIPIPIADSAHLYDSRAHARLSADRTTLSRTVPTSTESQFESLIDQLARASSSLPNTEAWRLLLEGLKSRGIDPVTATHLRPRIWARRKELVKGLKAVRRQVARNG